MGHWDEERGEILLPSAAVPKVKKALRDAHNAHAERVYEHAKQFWKQHGTQSSEKYHQRADAYCDKLAPSGWSGPDPAKEELSQAVRTVLDRVAHDRKGANLRGATWDDMDTIGLGRKTNRDTTFSTTGHSHASVTIDGRTLRWSTERNRRAIERFHASVVGRALYRELGRTEWTRGSGGVVETLDEISSEEHFQGPSLRDAYGPRGAQTYKHATGMYPYGSPEWKAEETRRRRAATKKKRKPAAPKKKAGGGQAQFCGSMKADGSGLCGRRLAGGRCPDHGTTSKAAAVVATSAPGSGKSAAAADPFA